jgi:hypothetical protein
MRNVDVDNMLRIAGEKGRTDIEQFDVKSFLAAKAILQEEPSHEVAKTIVNNFLTWLDTGNRTITFLEFTIPEELTLTEEEEVEEKTARDEFLAAQKKHA